MRISHQPRTPGPAEGLRLTVDVASVAFEGKGVARHEGRVVFVPHTAPGDRAAVRVTRDRKSFLEAELEEVLTPGPGRREPPCPHCATCGGCQLMHLTYAAQLEAKRVFVRDALHRIGHVQVEPDAVVGAQSDTGYRRRATLRGRTARGGVVLGFLRQQTHDLVDVAHCMVLAPALDRAAAMLRAQLEKEAEALGESELRVDMVADADDRVALLVWIARRDTAVWDRIARALFADGVVVEARDEAGRTVSAPPATRLRYALNAAGRTLDYHFTPGAFTQINFEQNQRLVDTVLALAGEGPFARTLDLYSGIGNYSLPLALRSGTLTGIESAPHAVEDARASAARAGITNATFIASSAQAGVAELIRTEQTFDLVLLNPTRAGAEGIGRELVRLRAPRMIYVSCHPPTLARDIALLVADGYRLERVVPIDLFPQTYHVESVAVLTL